MRVLGLVLVAGVLSACAGSPADPSLDAEAKLFRAPADKACLYVVPTPGPSAVAVVMDGGKIATLAAQNYLRLDVPPGRHVVYVTPASVVPVFSRETRDDVTVEALAGHCYFLRTVWTEEGRSWRQPRAYLERMTEAEGRRAVNVLWLTLPTK